MNEKDLLARILAAKSGFGPVCGKYSGAVTTQVLKAALQTHDVHTSSRDVFIKHIALEIDLLIPKPGALAEDGILYRPEDVVVAFEIKNSGAFGAATLATTQDAFKRIRDRNPSIHCVYVTLSERRGYRWAITPQNLGWPAFTLFQHSGSAKNLRHESTGDFDKLLAHLKDCIGRAS
jgi:hypothetical protein